MGSEMRGDQVYQVRRDGIGEDGWDQVRRNGIREEGRDQVVMDGIR